MTTTESLIRAAEFVMDLQPTDNYKLLAIRHILWQDRSKNGLCCSDEARKLADFCTLLIEDQYGRKVADAIS